MAKRLKAYVHVNGTVYGPKDKVPADVAALIVNPKAWAGKGDDVEEEDEEEQAERLTGDYSEATGPALKAEIAARNEGRDDDAKLSASGNKAALVAVLEADDAASGA